MSKRLLKPVDLNLDEPGKDLSRMFAASLSSNIEARQPTLLSLDHLLDNPYQPRVRMEEAALEELARVIQGQGFQGVLAARPHPEKPGFYQLTAGHRRRAAAKRAGLSVLPVVVQELSNEEMVTLAITENIQREDLTPLEEGTIYLLMSDEMGYTLEQMAKEVGKTVGYIYNRLRVAKAPSDVQALVQEKPDSLRAVANLIKVENPIERAEIIGQLLEGRITTDDLPSYIKALAEERRTTPLPPQMQGASLSVLLPSYGSAVATPPSKRSDSASDEQLDAGPHDAQSDAKGKVPEAVAHSGHTEFVTAPPVEEAEIDNVLVNGVQMPVEWRQRSGRAETINGAGPDEREERIRLRARRSRVSRMLGLILSFSDGLREDESLSEEEKLELATIAVVADRLCTRFGIRKDG